MKISIVLIFISLVVIFMGLSSATDLSSCIHTGGTDLFNKGAVTGTNFLGQPYSSTDFCSINVQNKISKFSCVGTSPNSVWMTCPTGYQCSDGACISINTPNACVSAGGTCRLSCQSGEYNTGILNCGSGNNCCKTGSVTTCLAGTEQPFCSNLDLHKIYQCSNGVTSSIQTCPTGQTCSNGQCQSTSTGGGLASCLDSDNGLDLSKKGTVTGTNTLGQAYNVMDFCSVTDQSRISEFVCIGNDVSGNWYTCPTGTKCVDGACSSMVVHCNIPTPEGLGGQCRDICLNGERQAGFGSSVGCSGTDNCCVQGSTGGIEGSCPVGQDTPFCNSIDDTMYFKCNGGIVTGYTCQSGHKCSEGQACFHDDSILGRLKETFVDPIVDLVKSVKDGTVNMLRAIKLFIIVIVSFISVLLAYELLAISSVFRKKNSEIYRWIISIIFGGFVWYILNMFIGSFLFWVIGLAVLLFYFSPLKSILKIKNNLIGK